MKYDSQNQLIETIYPDNTPDTLDDNPRTKTEYDELGNKITLVDKEGRATHYSYREDQQPTGMILPDDTPNDPTDNSRVSIDYNNSGKLKSLLNSGVRTDFERDSAGRIIASHVQNDSQVITTRFTYDAAGRKTSETDALGHKTRYIYDALDRITETIYSDGSVEKNIYNGAGKTVGKIDRLGRKTTFEYNLLDQLVAVINPALSRTEYGYDEAGNLTLQKDANGHITRYEYDGVGRKIATVRPLGQRYETTYNTIGQVIKTHDFNGSIITYEYDLEKHLSAKNYVTEGHRLEVSRTKSGRIETVIDNRGTTHYTYNEQGQIVKRIEPDNTQISYTYDKLTGKVKTVTSPSGTTTYLYNGLSLLSAVVDHNNNQTTYEYDVVGNLTKIIRPNSTVQTYKYDNLNRQILIENKQINGTVLASYAYSYDQVGNIETVTELNGRQVSYKYDELNRLVQESIIDPLNGNRTISYAFDSIGNRISKNDSIQGLITYNYDANDRLLSEAKSGVVKTYTYDQNGNLLTSQSSTNLTNYKWNSENQLTSIDINQAGGSKHIDYQYDINGIRVAQNVDGQETKYLIDEVRKYAMVAEEYNSSSRKSYVYGDKLVSQEQLGNTSYYSYDNQSGIRQLMNSQGNLTDSYSYSAYGELIQSIGTTSNSYLYRGEQFDQNTNLQYLRARYYDPTVGRFSTVDPLEGSLSNPVERHRYMYGNDNPISYSDPSGKFSISEIAYTIAVFDIIAASASSVQAISGAALSLISGGYKKWDGVYLQASPSLGLPYFFSGACIGAAATREEIGGKSITGAWGIILFGTSLSVSPLSILGGTFHAMTPRASHL
jgi:RHS repeat-associated protein